jgi:hypothetical protein
MIVATGVSCRDLCLAIESNSFVIVATKGVPFSRGGDPNVNVQGETPTCTSVGEFVIVRKK